MNVIDLNILDNSWERKDSSINWISWIPLEYRIDPVLLGHKEPNISFKFVFGHLSFSLFSLHSLPSERSTFRAAPILSSALTQRVLLLAFDATCKIYCVRSSKLIYLEKITYEILDLFSLSYTFRGFISQ